MKISKLLVLLVVICFLTKVNAEDIGKKLGEVVYTLDFSKSTNKDAKAGLQKMGFQLEKDMTSDSLIKLSFKKDRLYFNILKPAFGLAVKSDVKVEGASFVRITWGIDKYPKGVGYAKGINREALLLMIYFGKEKFSGGHFWLPKSPYFIGLYLAETDPYAKAFVGKNYKKQGRFISLGKAELGKKHISVFNISKAFKSCFKKNAVPYISGLTFEVDTSGTTPGTAKAFIEKIEFLKEK